MSQRVLIPQEQPWYLRIQVAAAEANGAALGRLHARAAAGFGAKAKQYLNCTKCDASEGIFVGNVTDRASLDAFFAQHTMRARSGRVRARVLVARRSSSRARERVGVSRVAWVLRVPHEDSDES